MQGQLMRQSVKVINRSEMSKSSYDVMRHNIPARQTTVDPTALMSKRKVVAPSPYQGSKTQKIPLPHRTILSVTILPFNQRIAVLSSKGFLKVLDDHTLALADNSGNWQYITWEISLKIIRRLFFW